VNVIRTRELDGLRGIAALMVVFWHFFTLFPVNSWTLVWKLSPLYMLIAGREAVVIFFVLSGFALDRMWQKAKNAGYAAFAFRRAIRIYGPYLGALMLAIAGNFLLSKGYREGFSPWFNRTWPVPVHSSDVLQHVFFLGVYNTTLFNAAFWSLVHEMRISLVFPVLLALAAYREPFRQVAIAVVLLIMGTFMTATLTKNTDLGDSVHFAGLFVFGICISEHQSRLEQWYQRLNRFRVMAFAVAAFILFFYGRLAVHVLPLAYASMLDLPVGFGASGIVVFAFSSARTSNLLTSSLVAWLGDLSYSVYLVHSTVLFALVNLLNLGRPGWALLCLYVPLTILVADRFHAWIERPLLNWSRMVTVMSRLPVPRSLT